MSIRRVVWTLSWAAAIVASASGAAGTGSTVAVRLFQFRPGALEVMAGTRVVWTNDDEIRHTVTAGTPERRDGRFDLTLDGKGATGEIQFAEPGVYPYFCRRHQHMRGEIHVK
jgi:plastocyanin